MTGSVGVEDGMAVSGRQREERMHCVVFDAGEGVARLSSGGWRRSAWKWSRQASCVCC